MKKLSRTRTLDTSNELRVRLKLKLKCDENTHFYHEETTIEEQFITAIHFVDKDIIDIGIFLNKAEKELGMAIRGDINIDMQEMISKSKAIATKAHTGQIRKLGSDKDKPYIVHPERIASKFDDPFLICIGWLHDVVEDTDITLDDLKKEGFPPEVIMGVDGMTKRHEENYLDFILRAKQNAFAKPVKIADVEDNMISLNEGSLKDKYRMALYLLKGR